MLGYEDGEVPSFNSFSICEMLPEEHFRSEPIRNADLCFFILEGSGCCLVNGRRFKFKQGDVMWIPGNCAHETYCTGDGPLRFLLTETPKNFNQTEPFVRAYDFLPASHDIPQHYNCSGYIVIAPTMGGSDTIELNVNECHVNGGAGNHVHEDADHLYYFISGHGESTVGGETLRYGPGDALYIPMGVPHDMKNTGQEDLKMIVTLAPVRQFLRKSAT